MRISQRVRRLLATGATGAMVLSLLPAGIAAADDTIDIDDVAACAGTEGLVEFNDNLGSAARGIECIAAYGITVGDNAGNFNPGATVTRQQMALFIARLAVQAQSGNTDIPVGNSDAFDDISGVNPAEARHAINLIEELGITRGTSGGGSYNPGGLVTRQQMASFIARAHDALNVDFDAFSDEGSFSDVVAGSTHAPNIDRLLDAGVVQGFSDGTYRPALGVTRGQIALFISRSIGVLETQGLWNGQWTADAPFDVALSWINETDGEGNYRLGEFDAEGFATLDVNESDNSVAFTVDYSDVTGPFGVAPGFHIHEGAIDENGPIVVSLAAGADLEAETDQTLSGFVSVDVTDFDVSDLLTDVEGYYLNLHSDEFPAGAIRGQLPDGGQDQIPSAPGQTLTVTPADAETVTSESERVYTVTNPFADTAYRVQLIDADNVGVATDGVVTFEAQGTSGDEAGFADAGVYDSRIISVNGEATADGGVAFVPDVTADGGQITFTVAGRGAESVVPLVFFDANGNDQFDINPDGTPVDAERFGIGGQLNVVSPT